MYDVQTKLWEARSRLDLTFYQKSLRKDWKLRLLDEKMCCQQVKGSKWLKSSKNSIIVTKNSFSLEISMVVRGKYVVIYQNVSRILALGFFATKILKN